MGIRFPFLSLAERDRRHDLARRFMDEQNLDALVLTEGGSRCFRHWTVNQFYLSNEPDGQCPIVVMPRNSPPVLFLIRTHWGIVQNELTEGVQPWIEDLRLSEPDPAVCVADFLNERGLGRGRIGVIASAANNAWPHLYGSLEDPLWRAIGARLPDVEGVDVATPFTLLALPRSAEEVELARAAGRALDEAGRSVLAAAKIGMTEVDLYAASVEALARGGCDQQYFLLSSGSEIWGIQQPRWFFPKREPRVMAAGDIVFLEFFPAYGGIDTQMQICIHFGAPSEQVQSMAKAGRAAYEAGNAALRPGARFGDVWRPMADAIASAGGWSWGPNIHSLPLQLMGEMHQGLHGRNDLPEVFRGLPTWDWGDRSPIDDLVMKEGMLFANEPGIAMGRQRLYQGNMVVCGANGAEELTTMGGHLHVVE